MKKILLTMAAALALVSCSQDDLMTGIENRPTGAIGAKVFVPTVTRGTALNNEGDLVTAKNGFDLYAFLVNDNSQFMGAATDGNNVGVPFVGSGTEGAYVWNYENESQMRFWSEADGSDIKFFAVSPKNALTESFLTKTISHDSQTFDYTTPETCSAQVDLMYGVTVESQYSSTTGEHLENGISLQFRHALSQIVFKAKTESELIYADVADVKIKNIYQTGSFDVATAETYRTADDKSAATFPWTGYAELKEFTAQLGGTAPTNINTQYDDNGEATGTTNENGNYQDGRLTDSSEALLLIPQNLEYNNAVLAITCSVRYKRGEGDEPTIVDNQTIVVPVTTNWQPGYKYTYTLIFTAEMGNPIKVQTVGVDEWNDAGNTDVIVDDDKDENLFAFAGKGTAESPFEIKTEDDLVRLSELVAEGNETYKSAYYKQMNNIDLSTVCGASSSSFTPIGYESDNVFSGKYDGQGNSITNLYINDENHYIGLFGRVANAEIKGISVSGEIKSTRTEDAVYVGGIVGYGESTFISDCTSMVSITGGDKSGGIGGYITSGSTVMCCVNKGNVISNDEGDLMLGGIVGQTYLRNNAANTIVACYNIGSIGSDKKIYCAGGIVGYNHGTVIYACYNTGNISEATYEGGISGTNFNATSYIEYCYYGGNCTYEEVCGFVAYEGTDPTNCYKVDESEIQWSTGDDSAMSKMNTKISELASSITGLLGWSYEVNTDEETKTTTPLVLKYTAN